MSAKPFGDEVELDLDVHRKESIAEGVVLLSLRRSDGTDLPAWRPGAHIDLLLPGQTRQYSLCGDPADRSTFKVAVLREHHGRGGSRYVHDVLAPGDTVRMRGPRNNFPLVPARRYRFIAGGIGITPLLPMIAAVHAGNADWQLTYGGRSPNAMAFRDRLSAYGNRVRLWPEDQLGLLDLDSLLADLRPDTAVYCCGPEGLLAAVEHQCAQRGHAELHVERFAAKPEVCAGPNTSFEVVLARSGETLLVPPDRSILDVADEAGAEVYSSCEQGTCGTCETEVLEGVPEHRDSLLTDDERADGDTMLICVSRAHTPRIVLDL